MKILLLFKNSLIRMAVRYDHRWEVCVPSAVKGWKSSPLSPCTRKLGGLWAGARHWREAGLAPGFAAPQPWLGRFLHAKLCASAAFCECHHAVPTSIRDHPPLLILLGDFWAALLSPLGALSLPGTFPSSGFEGSRAFPCWFPGSAGGVWGGHIRQKVFNVLSEAGQKG